VCGQCWLPFGQKGLQPLRCRSLRFQIKDAQGQSVFGAIEFVPAAPAAR